MVEKKSGNAGLSITSVMHMAGGKGAQKNDFRELVQETTEMSPAGNAVSIEDEMMKVGQAQMEFELTTNLYRKHAQLLKMALGRNG